jgi:predicted metal-dependent peptidase
MSNSKMEDLAFKAIQGAKGKLILSRDAKSAFFATLLLRLKLEADAQVETIATDGRRLIYTPEFVLSLSSDELLGVLVHEVMHNALKHPLRRDGRDLERWNIACDLAINPILIEAGFVLPHGHLIPGARSYLQLQPGHAAEFYYALLPVEKEGTEGSYGTCGKVIDPTQQEENSIESDWQVAVTLANHAAKQKGELPGGLARMVQHVVQPKTSWVEVLRQFLSTVAKNDFCWSKPNRRFLSQGLYLPGLHSEELGEVILAVDCSGSIDQATLGLFAKAIEAILEAFDCSLIILYHDTQVQGVQTWSRVDGPLQLQPVGGGGTSHRCIFRWLNENEHQATCVVCLTDLVTSFPNHIPEIPVIWAKVGSATREPPFGQVVGIE